MNYNSIAGRKIERIEAISDGVFAIALTLLVLDLKVPLSETIRSEGDLLSALRELTPKMLSYFLSFMTIGIFWTGHTTHFSYINKSDRHLNWISLFFLMFVSLLPFTTAFLSEHINFKISIGLYWLNLLLLGIMIYTHWNYALKHQLLNLPDDQKRQVNRAVTNRIIVYQLLYAAGALLCFINTYLSLVTIILIQLNSAFAVFSKPINEVRDESGNTTQA